MAVKTEDVLAYCEWLLRNAMETSDSFELHYLCESAGAIGCIAQKRCDETDDATEKVQLCKRLKMLADLVANNEKLKVAFTHIRAQQMLDVVHRKSAHTSKGNILETLKEMVPDCEDANCPIHRKGD